MCQLFGLNSAKPVTPHFSLRGFFRRGGGTDHHGDGWGLAYYEDAQSFLRVRDTAAHQCLDVQAMLARPFRSANVIAHVRKATVGEINDRNSHPFVRRLWGKDWVFAHNGDLKDFHPDLHQRFIPQGETDSERAFCHLLGSLVEKFGDALPVFDQIQDHVARVSAEIAGHGPFNFLLSDGSALLAHCSTDLYWTERAAPFVEVELLDTDESIHFGNHNDQDDRVVVVATKPLTRGEAWHPMVKGELTTFIGGRRYYRMQRTAQQCRPKNAPATLGWSTGWELRSGALV